MGVIFRNQDLEAGYAHGYWGVVPQGSLPLRKAFLKIEEIKAFSYNYGKEKIEKI